MTPLENTCDACGKPLGWLEGPECDGCVTKPLPRGADKYEAVRGVRGQDVDEGEWVLCDHGRNPDTCAECGWRPARDRLAIDLVTGEVVFQR